jgi:hypothetical protein
MAPPMGRVETGRTYPRLRNYECESCHQRNAIGAPRASDTWPASLSINAKQMDLLLIAAAEFRDLSEEAGEHPDAIDFLDWVRPDALTRGFASPAGMSSEATMDRHKGVA